MQPYAPIPKSPMQIPSPSCQNIEYVPESPRHLQSPTPCQEGNLENNEISPEIDQDQVHLTFDQDIIYFDDPTVPNHPIQGDPFLPQEHTVFPNPVDILLPNQDHDVPPILPNDSIQNQEKNTLTMVSNGPLVSQDQSIASPPYLPQAPIIPQDSISLDEPTISPSPPSSDPVYSMSLSFLSYHILL